MLKRPQVGRDCSHSHRFIHPTKKKDFIWKHFLNIALVCKSGQNVCRDTALIQGAEGALLHLHLSLINTLCGLLHFYFLFYQKGLNASAEWEN